MLYSSKRGKGTWIGMISSQSAIKYAIWEAVMHLARKNSLHDFLQLNQISTVKTAKAVDSPV
jgi:hypothetical protein